MKRNENIFISAEIKKDWESKKLMPSVRFDKTAPNVLTECDTIVWYPTCDEIDFIAEVFDLIRGVRYLKKIIEKPQNTTTLSGENTTDSSYHSSEMRIPPLEDDRTMEVRADVRSSRINDKRDNEKIFFQADEKKIDEILNRKKMVTKEDCVMESGEKTLIDRMLKPKKKKH
jgi:hypothetical protein